MKPIQWFTLYKLAEMGAFSQTIKVSTEYLAEKLGCSQQTASRHLIKLEREGLIERMTSIDGSLIKIAESGRTELKKVYSILNSVIEKSFPPSVVLEGELFSGVGDGAYYLSRSKYREQFFKKLGFDPYPGTLNLKLISDYDKKARLEIDSYPAIEIEGFEEESRTFGSVRCFLAIINNKVEGAVISAIRTHYDSSVLEIIAPIYLRDRLKLKDGDRVKIEILVSQRE